MMRCFYRIDKAGNVLSVNQSQDDTEPKVEAEQPKRIEIPLDQYGAAWDEVKRCPYAKDGSPRYRLVRGVLTPTASVLDIDYDSARMMLNADGTLMWK